MMLDHVVIPVRNAAASLRFWREVIGFPLVQAQSGADWNGYPWLMMNFDVGEGRQVVLTARAGETLPGEGEVRHYAFCVPTDAERDGWRARLQRAGVPTREEDHGSQRSLYLEDPSGIVLEITAPPSGTLPPDPGAADVVGRWLEIHAGGV